MLCNFCLDGILALNFAIEDGLVESFCIAPPVIGDNGFLNDDVLALLHVSGSNRVCLDGSILKKSKSGRNSQLTLCLVISVLLQLNISAGEILSKSDSNFRLLGSSVDSIILNAAEALHLILCAVNGNLRKHSNCHVVTESIGHLTSIPRTCQPSCETAVLNQVNSVFRAACEQLLRVVLNELKNFSNGILIKCADGLVRTGEEFSAAGEVPAGGMESASLCTENFALYAFLLEHRVEALNIVLCEDVLVVIESLSGVRRIGEAIVIAIVECLSSGCFANEFLNLGCNISGHCINSLCVCESAGLVARYTKDVSCSIEVLQSFGSRVAFTNDLNFNSNALNVFMRSCILVCESCGNFLQEVLIVFRAPKYECYVSCFNSFLRRNRCLRAIAVKVREFFFSFG